MVKSWLEQMSSKNHSWTHAWLIQRKWFTELQGNPRDEGTNENIHLQSQLLKGLDRVQRRVWILLKNFHLIRVLDEITSYQLVQQRLCRLVLWNNKFIAMSCIAINKPSILMAHNEKCLGASPEVYICTYVFELTFVIVICRFVFSLSVWRSSCTTGICCVCSRTCRVRLIFTSKPFGIVCFLSIVIYPLTIFLWLLV